MDGVLRGPLREILKSGLLVEDDRLLVEEKLQNGVKYRSGKAIFVAFLLIAISMYFLCGFLESKGLVHLSFALKVFLNIYIVIGLYILHVLLIPFVVRICAYQFNRVDYRYHSFVAQIRQNESAIYGIQQRFDNDYVYAKESRKRCVEELRKLVDQTHEFNYQFPSDIPSMDEFITDELRILSDIEENIQFDHLQFDALKALWQFTYLQRSEALRNFVIYHHDECCRLLAERDWWVLLRFSRISLFNFVKFTWSISKFDVYLESVPVNTQCDRRVKAKKQSELNKTITKLEYLLDNLHQMDSMPEDRTAIINTLLNIANSLETHPMMNVDFINDRNDENDQEVNDMELQEEREECNEYEVYEASVDGESLDSVDHYTQMDDPLIECREDLQAELKHVLVERKKQTQELELKALAKQRNKTVDEVRKELDEESKPVNKKEREEIPIRQNPTVIISQQELTNAIRRRFNNQPILETIGDLSDSE